MLWFFSGESIEVGSPFRSFLQQEMKLGELRWRRVGGLGEVSRVEGRGGLVVGMGVIES